MLVTKRRVTSLNGKIATWNANGLAKHSQEIKTFIFNQNVDILFVSEIYFTNKNRLLLYFWIYIVSGYTMRLDSKVHGRIALIRNGIRMK